MATVAIDQRIQDVLLDIWLPVIMLPRESIVVKILLSGKHIFVKSSTPKRNAIFVALPLLHFLGRFGGLATL
jgi:hypothetical protein